MLNDWDMIQLGVSELLDELCGLVSGQSSYCKNKYLKSYEGWQGGSAGKDTCY